jgi:hypothetical protein
MELKRGDLIEIRWWDITEDPVGNPARAVLPVRHSVGYFWGCNKHDFITTMTMDEDVADQSGYAIYPVGVIAGVNIVKRGRGKHYKALVPDHWPALEQGDQQHGG